MGLGEFLRCIPIGPVNSNVSVGDCHSFHSCHLAQTSWDNAWHLAAALLPSAVALLKDIMGMKCPA